MIKSDPIFRNSGGKWRLGKEGEDGNNASWESGLRAMTGKWRPGLQRLEAGQGMVALVAKRRRKNAPGRRNWIVDSRHLRDFGL